MSKSPSGSRGGKHGGASKQPARSSERPRRQPNRQASGPTQRQLRVAEEIRHVLAGVFARREFRDPELAEATITVSEVRISPDLKHATAFVSWLGRTDVQMLLPALKRSAPWLRSQVAHALPLRYAPELSFQPDHALEYATKIDRLMHQPEVARDLKAED